MTRKQPRRHATLRRTFASSEDDALDLLAGIWSRHGAEAFNLNLRGPGRSALLLAVWLGWVWPAASGAHVTLAGLRALSVRFGRDLLGEWIEAERRHAAEPEPEPWRIAA